MNKITAKEFRSSLIKKSKYGNKKTAGYDSKKESERASQLKWMQECGQISELKEQVKYLLVPAHYENGKCIERACNYIADFTYWRHYENGAVEFIVEDCKGMRTDVYKIKRKLMLSIYKIKIKET